MRTSHLLPYGGVSVRGRGLPNRAPLDRHPPDRDSQRPPGQRSPWTESPRDPWTETPWTETLPDRDSQRLPGQRLSETPGQRPPGQRPAEQRPPWRDPPSHVTCGECWNRDAPPDRILDTCLWKHYLAATSLRTVIIWSFLCNVYVRLPTSAVPSFQMLHILHNIIFFHTTYILGCAMCSDGHLI